MRNHHLLLLGAALLCAQHVPAQIEIEMGMSLEEYVNDILLGSGVQAFNITYTGGTNQLGYLTGGGDDFSLESGLVLSTDNAENPACPEDFNPCDGCMGLYDDPDLLDLANSVPPLIGETFTVQDINDPCILEFDFIAAGDTVRFDYVFGSDEYLTFVNTQYNDIFAFFLSGPGITGPYASPAGFPDGSVNIAGVPNTDPVLPVTISSVNNVTNSEYYLDNPWSVDQSPCLNGFTVPFTAEHEVECGEVYHIKLAIADGTDSALESIVVLEEGSFQSNAVVQIDLTIDVGGPDANTIYEGCGMAQLSFTRPIETVLSLEEMVIINYDGSVATNGVDFTELPDTVIFEPFVETIIFDLAAFVDGEYESEEIVMLEILNLAACNNDGLMSYFEFYVADDPDSLVVVGDTLDLCPGGDVVLFPTVTGGYGNYTYTWCDGSDSDTLFTAPDDTYTCQLIVADTCGWPEDAATFDVIVHQPPNASAGEDLFACGEATLGGTILDAPPASCGEESGSFSYCYGENENMDWTYCPDNPGDGTYMTVAFSQGSTENFFDSFWVYDGPNTAAPVLAGPISGNLAGMVFTATNPNGCITIQLLTDASVSCQSGGWGIEEWEYTVGCTNAGYVDWLWSPSEGLSAVNLPNPLVDVVSPETYTLTASLAYYPFCSMTDEVEVSPSFDFTFSQTNPSCFANDGSITVDVVPAGGTGPFQIHVLNQEGVEVAGSVNWGGVSNITGLDGGNYYLQVEDAFCDAEETFTLVTPEPLTISVSSDTTICINGTADLVATMNVAADNVEWFWSNGGDAASIGVSPSSQTDYTVYATYDAGCETNGGVIGVSLYDPLAMTISTGAMVCEGDSALIGVNEVYGGLAPYSYDWTAASSGGALNLSAEAQFVFPEETAEFCIEVSDACETPTVWDCALVEIPEEIDPGFVADTLGGCFPVTIVFTGLADNPGEIASIEWTFGDEQSSTSMGSAQHTYISEGVWDVSQTIVSIHGCVYSSVEPMLIATYPWPVAEFSADPWQQALPETRVEFANYSLGAETYEWDFGGFETSLAEHPVFTFPDTQSGEYTVSLVSENAWGCRDTVEHTVMIQESFALFIPNMFTPDNDGLNDAWQLTGIDVDRAEFQVWVLDRWGEMVFHSTNIEEPWIGDMMGGGHYVPNGTYLYRVEARSLATGENHVATGHVTLAR